MTEPTKHAKDVDQSLEDIRKITCGDIKPNELTQIRGSLEWLVTAATADLTAKLKAAEERERKCLQLLEHVQWCKDCAEDFRECEIGREIIDLLSQQPEEAGE